MGSRHADAFLFFEDAEGDLHRVDVPDHPMTVGRRPYCGFALDEPSVGPIHAAIERGASGCRLRRLSRVRAVTVNGAAATASSLETGDAITLGEARLLYVEAPEVAPELLRMALTRGDDETPIELAIAGSVTSLGRMEGDVLIDDDSVSSRHLEIENFGPGLRWVRDLGSTNGSELNGEPLGEARRALGEGDVITLGRVKMRVGEAEAAPASLTSVVQRTIIFVQDSATA